MKMTILPRDDKITHVVLAGRLDTTGAEKISESFAEVTAAQERPTIIDLSEIEFMASRGIGLLLVNAKKLMKAGQKLVLLNPREMVASVLESSKVDRVMPIVRDLDEAIQILQGAPAAAQAAGPPPGTLEADARPRGSEAAAAAPAVTDGELKLSIKNELSELEGLNAAFAQFLDVHGVPHRAAYAVNLAIDELVVNVMRYAYVDDDTHLIDIELAVEGDQVILRIVDDGRPFDPRRGPVLDLHAEEREVGGLGLHLVLDMVDVLTYRRTDERNWVEVRVHIVPEVQHQNPPEAGRDGSEMSEE